MNPRACVTYFGSLPFLLIVLLMLPFLKACSQSAPSEEEGTSCIYIDNGFGPDGTVQVTTETVITGLEVPWGIAFLPNGDLLVTERPGRLRLVKNYASGAFLVAEPVATVNIASTSEGGLLGIALHPDFESNRLFYMYMTVEEGGSETNQIEQWKLSKDGTSASRQKVLYGNIASARNHNGGRLAFGPDGMLYAGTGDASEPDLSQNIESPNGKLLRFTPEGTIPDDNPVAGNPMFIMGIRNTEGWDWPDKNDAGEVWLTDHGPSGEMLRFAHDEVNIAHKNDNLGWPAIYKCQEEKGMLPPVITWGNAVPPGGAAIYTGSKIQEWKGSLLIGTLGSEHLHRVVIKNGSVAEHEVYFKNTLGRLREVIMSPEGDLYITTSNCDGRGNCPSDGDKILRVVKK